MFCNDKVDVFYLLGISNRIIQNIITSFSSICYILFAQQVYECINFPCFTCIRKNKKKTFLGKLTALSLKPHSFMAFLPLLWFYSSSIHHARYNGFLFIVNNEILGFGQSLKSNWCFTSLCTDFMNNLKILLLIYY